MKLIVALLIVAAAGGALFVWSGVYDISATDQHLAPTYRLLDVAMRRSVKQRAGEIEAPPLGEPQQVRAGLAVYRAHCVQCHGAPGVAPARFALGMTPVPVPLVHTARSWTAAEMFWVIKEGIKMTGMPAWKYRMSNEDMWAVVAFLPVMAQLTPQEYAQLEAPARPVHEQAPSGEPSAKRGE
jgi:mono/diheme cytochrome c family protein